MEKEKIDRDENDKIVADGAAASQVKEDKIAELKKEAAGSAPPATPAAPATPASTEKK